MASSSRSRRKPEAVLEELADPRPRLGADVVLAGREDGRAPEVAVPLEQVAHARIADGGDLAAALGLDADLPGAEQARDAGLHDVRRVAVGRATEVGEQRRPADAALRLDVFLDATRTTRRRTRRRTAAGVELEDAEVAREELGRRAGELGLDELKQLGRRDLASRRSAGKRSGSSRLAAWCSATANASPWSSA